MGISIKRWILSKLGLGGTSEISSLELQQALEEYRIRELAFHTCVAMIANAHSRPTESMRKTGARSITSGTWSRTLTRTVPPFCIS